MPPVARSVLSLLLVLVAILSLAACGGGGGSKGVSIVDPAPYYTGVKTAAALSVANAEELATSAYAGGTLGTAVVMQKAAAGKADTDPLFLQVKEKLGDDTEVTVTASAPSSRNSSKTASLPSPVPFKSNNVLQLVDFSCFTSRWSFSNGHKKIANACDQPGRGLCRDNRSVSTL